eukprot:scaffold74634_cov90-Phaeocystis_antarctica.AAC.1
MPTAEHIGADAVQHAEGGEPLEQKVVGMLRPHFAVAACCGHQTVAAVAFARVVAPCNASPGRGIRDLG